MALASGATVTREEQLRRIRLDAHLGLNAYIAMIEAYRAEIEDLMVARVDAGYDLYGTDGWRKTPYELTQDAKEEAADGGAYMVMRRHRLRHP